MREEIKQTSELQYDPKSMQDDECGACFPSVI